MTSLTTVSYLIGTFGDNTLVGTMGDDVIFGFDGNDTLHSLGGSDLLNGGAGVDTVVFTGSRADYEVTLIGLGDWIIEGTDGTSKLIGIETLQFSDTSDGYNYIENILSGTAGDDTMVGGDGIDSFNGDAGADVLIGHGGPDRLRGEPGDDTLDGGDGNDILNGGDGNDVLDGGEGVDTAIFSGNHAAYQINATVANTSVTGLEGSDVLTDVERLQFDDKKIAIGESASNTVRIIGAAFDVSAIEQHPEWVGMGLQLFDSGLTMLQVCELVIGVLGYPSNETLVTTVYENVVGVAPSDFERDFYVGLLQGSGGTMSQAQLLEIAANSPLTADTIDLVGLQQAGVEFV